MNIILLGSQGVGKGTYAAEMSKKLDIPHVAIGDIFRKHIAEKTELGVKAKQFMDKGNLDGVIPDRTCGDIRIDAGSDDIVEAVDQICKSGIGGMVLDLDETDDIGIERQDGADDLVPLSGEF